MARRRAPDPPPAGAESCVHHSFERAERVCRDCGHWLCDQCIVTPWGSRKAALCVDCALGRGGVRTTASQAPVRTGREIRKLERQARDGGTPTAMSAASAAALHRAAPVVAESAEEDTPSRRLRLRRLRPST
jgi:hypothetical protein